MASLGVERRLPCGIEVQRDGAHARVWAPAVRNVEVVVVHEARETRHRLARETDGHYSGFVEGLGDGDRYWFALEATKLRPDPCSRFQPEGPHGPSMVADPSVFPWTDHAWRGVRPDANVLYELHVGTFTPEGTWRAAAAQLPALADLGITAIEMMPIAEFPGRFGWGYDGVALYAPAHIYGTPNDLRAFIDGAHALGIAVILDVVYNHLGPDGNYLHEFSPEYFTDKYENDWGEPINFEGPPPAREYFVANAAYWIDEFHFDGLRLDATQDIHDASPEHVLATMVARARAAARGRRILIVAENEPQDPRLLQSREAGGYGMDAVWNDDFHHMAIVALTGRREAYYLDYKGSPQEFVSCAKYGYLYQGQHYTWQKKRRGGSALDGPRHAFVTYLENHDQVANTAFGRRLHQMTAPGRFRALTAILLLGPGTPMLFQGQEFGSSSPFLYFADHKAELNGPIADGRREFLGQFASLRDPEVTARLPVPSAAETFRRSQLDLSERERHHEMLAMHTDLIALRRTDAVLTRDGVRIDGAVLAPEMFLVRYFGGPDGDRLLIVNLGCDMDLSPAPEPLLAPPPGTDWTLRWSSEAVAYGGQGTPRVHDDGRWLIPGEAAVLLASIRGSV
jgi:maltooligosyltrehalose trehalohydrolase